MTIGRAIVELRMLREEHFDNEDERKALDMAIKALENIRLVQFNAAAIAKLLNEVIDYEKDAD